MHHRFILPPEIRMWIMSGFGLFIVFALMSTALAMSVTNFGGPPDTQTGVPVEAYIDRQFSMQLDPATVTTETVLLRENAGNTAGGSPSGGNLCTGLTVQGGNRVICNHPTLATERWHTVTFTTGIRSATGVALTATGTYRFRTSDFGGGNNFVPPPQVEGSVPQAGMKFPTNGYMSVTFFPGGSNSGTTMKTSGSGSVLDPSNVQLFLASNGQPTGSNLLACPSIGGNPAAPTDCNMSWDSDLEELTITPGEKAPTGVENSAGGTALVAGNSYIFIVNGVEFGPSGPVMGGATVQNTENMPMFGGDYRVAFTATGADTVGPDLKGSFPQNNATGVDRAIYDIALGFNEALDAKTVTGGSVLLYCEDNDADASNGCTNANNEWDTNDAILTGTTVDYDASSRDVILSPNRLLLATTEYYVRVMTGVKDLAGNSFDGDRSTGGNQIETVKFTTGTNVNGGATDTSPPEISFVNADNFEVAVTFTEPVKFNTTYNAFERTSSGLNDANNLLNWVLESPIGVPVNLAGKTVLYLPGDKTLLIGGFALPPNQTYRVKAQTSTGAYRIQDLSGNTMVAGSGSQAQGTVQSVFDTGGNLGPGSHGGESDFYTSGTSPTRVSPRSGLAGATSAYEVEFPTTTALPVGSVIVLTFPTGFSFVADGSAVECRDIINTFENNDINGPAANQVDIVTITCDTAARTVSLVTGTGATTSGDQLRFLLQGIVNSTVPKDYTTGGYVVDIKTKNPGGSQLESMTSMPFFLSQAGSQSIGGRVFNDNGDGVGTAGNNTQDGTEAGIQNIKVCMGGPMGYQCKTTDSNGDYSFGQLNNGFYGVDIPPLTTGTFVGGPFFRDVNLAGGAGRSDVNFAFRSAPYTVDVSISGIPSGTNLDVFAFNSFNSSEGGNIVREVLWNATPQDGTATVSIPVTSGTWEIGIGPWMPKDPSLGPQGMPTFSFMPPRPQQVTVAGGNVNLSFVIQSANRSILGKVVDGAGSGIPNAFVMARPAKFSDEVGGVGAGMTRSDGSFTLRVTDGVYFVESSMPGMPPSTGVEVTVVQDTSNSGTDGNGAADVYSNSVLIINDGDGDNDDLILKIAKGSYSIAGRVLDEAGDPISYAHVMAERVDGSGNPLGGFAEAPTDSTGNFTLYVGNATWKIKAFAPGYGELDTLTVTVNGENLTGQNLQAETADFGTIAGTVTKGGAVVAGAFVNIYGSSGHNSTVTGNDGTYSLKVQAGSAYTIDGFIPGSGPLSVLSGITATAGQTLAGQDLSMAAPGTIQVTISGVTNAFVEARDSSGRGNGASANTTAGVYSFNVPAGTYTVRAHSPSYGPLGTQASVVVTAGQTTSVAFTPPTTYRVSGLVASSTSNCQNGVSVVLADYSSGRVTSTTTSSTGSYAFNGMPNGTYRVSAGKPGCIDAAAPGTVTVNGANAAATTRTLAAASATVTGRVTLSSTGVTLPTIVRAERSDGTVAFAEVDTTASGGGNNYTLSLAAGTWVVAARSDGYESASTTVTLTENETETANLALTAIGGYTRKERTSSTVTPARGGVIRDSNIGSSFEMTIPPGAFGSDSDAASVTTSETTAIVTETPTTTIVGGKGYEITPKGADGQKITTLSSSDGAGVTLKIPYDQADITALGIEEADVVPVVWDGSKGIWEEVSGTVDTTNNVVTATISHFSTYGVGSPTGGGTQNNDNNNNGNNDSGTTTATTGGGGGGGRRSLLSSILSKVKGSLSKEGDTEKEQDRKARAERRPGFLTVSLDGKDVRFFDVPTTAWFKDAVSAVLTLGIASGYKDPQGHLTGEFKPGNSITFAEIARMALEASGRDVSSVTVVPENRTAQGDWSAPYIATAESLGLSVYAKGHLDVRQPATRGAVIQTILEALDISIQSESSLTKAVQERREQQTREKSSGTGAALTGTGAVLTGSGATATGSLTGTGGTVTGSTVNLAAPKEEAEDATAWFGLLEYKDLPKGHPYADALHTATARGILKGDSLENGTLALTVRPNDPINRAEVSIIFLRLMELGYVRFEE